MRQGEGRMACLAQKEPEKRDLTKVRNDLFRYKIKKVLYLIVQLKAY